MPKRSLPASNSSPRLTEINFDDVAPPQAKGSCTKFHTTCRNLWLCAYNWVQTYPDDMNQMPAPQTEIACRISPRFINGAWRVLLTLMVIAAIFWWAGLDERG